MFFPFGLAEQSAWRTSQPEIASDSITGGVLARYQNDGNGKRHRGGGVRRGTGVCCSVGRAGVNPTVTVAVSVGAGSLGRHRTMLLTEPVGLQQLPHPSLAAAVSVGRAGGVEESYPLRRAGGVTSCFDYCSAGALKGTSLPNILQTIIQSLLSFVRIRIISTGFSASTSP